MQKIHRHISQRNRKKVLSWQHLLPGVAENLISSNSVQVYGKQKTHKNICKSKKKEKGVAMATLVPGVAEKLISCSLCSGMESKESIKIFTSPRNKKSVAMATVVASYR